MKKSFGFSVVFLFVISYIFFYFLYPEFTNTLVKNAFLIIRSNFGDTESQLQLSRLYRKGNITLNPDIDNAVYWETKAAQLGHPLAQLDLGYAYEHGAGVVQNYEEAAKWYALSANQNNPMAEAYLGNFYLEGWGVPRDPVKSYELYLKAAEQGFELAQFKIGLFNMVGEGTPKNLTLAESWFLKANQTTHSAISEFMLGLYYINLNPPNYNKAQDWFKRSSEKNNGYGTGSLGFIYQYGLGEPKDLNKALQFYEKALAEGNFEAKYYRDAVRLEMMFGEKYQDIDWLGIAKTMH